MSLDNTQKLGRMIGGMTADQSVTNQNISPDESADQLQLVSSVNMGMGGVFTATKYVYPTDSFILDHPVYGELDSTILRLNGGYDIKNPDNGKVLQQTLY